MNKFLVKKPYYFEGKPLKVGDTFETERDLVSPNLEKVVAPTKTKATPKRETLSVL